MIDPRNPVFSNPLMYGGMRVILDATLADTVVDWANVRSPSRAMRRVRQGKRHHLPMTKRPKREAFRVGDAMVMHPELWKEIERELSAQAERMVKEMLKGPKNASDADPSSGTAYGRDTLTAAELDRKIRAANAMADGLGVGRVDSPLGRREGARPFELLSAFSVFTPRGVR